VKEENARILSRGFHFREGVKLNIPSHGTK